MTRSDAIIAQAEKYSARNYDPLPVVIERGEGVWVWDADGNKYLDCLSAYSAVNQGHCHPRILAALTEQAGRIAITSRAFHNARLGAFLEKLCKLTQMDLALPMNTGAEAVETAVKAARKWGYVVKGVADDAAEIIVCSRNFHGRTITAVSASSEPAYRTHFGPFTPGFVWVPHGDLAALEAAITERTVAFLLEPIQGEGGILIPPEGYLSAARKLCRERNVLFVLDEIQTGLGRTGELFCYQHEADAKPDMMVVGKALGGGVYPRLDLRRQPLGRRGRRCRSRRDRRGGSGRPLQGHGRVSPRAAESHQHREGGGDTRSRAFRRRGDPQGGRPRTANLRGAHAAWPADQGDP
jgi:ornithine--oxo-acid transaminase